MNKKYKGVRDTIFAIIACLSTVYMAPNVSAQNIDIMQVTPPFAPVFGRTLPPVGYVHFCARHTNECKPINSGSREVDLENHPEFWTQLQAVNEYVNGKITPVSDQQLYNVQERWEIPTNAGDCEDYVLLKKRHFEALGFPRETLLITVVLDEVGDGHAVLMVRTTRGDFILDNRRNEIRAWTDTGYHMIKRQSQKNPQIWVALTDKKSPTEVVAGHQ